MRNFSLSLTLVFVFVFVSLATVSAKTSDEFRIFTKQGSQCVVLATYRTSESNFKSATEKVTKFLLNEGYSLEKVLSDKEYSLEEYPNAEHANFFIASRGAYSGAKVVDETPVYGCPRFASTEFENFSREVKKSLK